MIGVFDSGLGGLTVLRALVERFPHIPFVYLGDHANVPYGDRGSEEVVELSRRSIEALFKSGCKLGRRQLGHADRIESCLAIDMVVAWRIYHLTKLGRETPAVPCSVFFEEHEWKALVAYVNKDPTPPENPPTLRQATHMVGTLARFLARLSQFEGVI